MRVPRTALIVAVLLIARPAAAKDSPQDRLESLASAIQKGDARQSIDLFDPQAAGFAEIKRNLEALSALPDTNCTIAITRTTPNGESVQFETDWSLQIYTRQNGPLLDRKDHVTLTLRRSGEAWIIVSLAPASVLAPPDPAIFGLIARLAGDLNDKNESGALGAFDSSMKQYGEIDNDIDALVTQNDVLCAIDVVTDRQIGDVHTLDLDWFFQLKSRADGGPTQERRERVQAVLKKTGNRWRIVSIQPLAILWPEISR